MHPRARVRGVNHRVLTKTQGRSNFSATQDCRNECARTTPHGPCGASLAQVVMGVEQQVDQLLHFPVVLDPVATGRLRPAATAVARHIAGFRRRTQTDCCRLGAAGSARGQAAMRRRDAACWSAPRGPIRTPPFHPPGPVCCMYLSAETGRTRVRRPSRIQPCWMLEIDEIQLPERDLNRKASWDGNGSPEIRTQDQSVKSRSADHQIPCNNRVLRWLCQGECQELTDEPEP